MTTDSKVVKHTPGEWRRRSIPGHLFEITSNGSPVLRIRGGMMPTLEDARLIAAAPEMLEMLDRIAAWSWGQHYTVREDEIFKELDALRRKAKGE